MKDENNVNIANNIDNEKTFSLSSSQITVVTNTGYKLTSLDLDKNFFENLLILEMELEDEFSMEKLLELVKQYSLAIEYYLQNDYKKAKAYQNRMEYLLTNKDTLMQLKRQNDKNNNINNDNNNEKNQKNEKNPKRKINKKIKSELNSKKGEIKLRQDDINIEDLSQKVNKFLMSNNKKGENDKSGKNIINSDLEKQNENWRERLKTKKRNNTRFTIKPSNDGIRKRFQTLGKNELSLSPITSDINLELTKESKTTDLKLTLREELYGDNELDEEDKKEENKIEEIKEDKNEDNKIVEEPIQENLNIEKIKGVENKIEGKDKNEIKEENINNEDIKEVKEKIEDKTEKNKIIEVQHEEKPKESKAEEDSKDINDIKEDKKAENAEEIQEQKEPVSISLEKAIESTNIDSEKKQKEDNPQSQIQEQRQAHRKMSLTEEMINIKLDEEISKSIESQITSLQNIISHLNQKVMSQNDMDNEEEEESEFSNSNTNLIKAENINNNIEKIPAKYLEIYKEIEKTIRTYLNDFNQNFYKEIFEQFSSGLKELYEQKYKKYIEIRNEYHNQIKENEYLLEIDDNLTKEKKEEIQQTIESLNEEQQHQIDVVEDEFNKKISDKIAEFKLNAFKHNSGIQLMEERVKFEIYSLINEAF